VFPRRPGATRCRCWLSARCRATPLVASLSGTVAETAATGMNCQFPGGQKPLQIANFIRMQLTKSPVGQRSQHNGSEGNTLQLDHLVTDSSQQPANFAIATFLQFQLKHSAASLMLDDSHSAKPEKALGKVHAFTELGENFRGRPAGNVAAVSSDNFKPRVCQSLSQIAIVGYQQQSGRILVQTADGEQSLVGHGNEIDRARSSVGVTVCAEDSAGLVQEEVAEAGQPQPFSVQPHITGLGMHRASRVRDNFAIDRDATIANVLFTVPSRIHTGHREKLLQSHDSRIFIGIGPGGVGVRCRS